jgi:hypothetical protein
MLKLLGTIFLYLRNHATLQEVDDCVYETLDRTGGDRLSVEAMQLICRYQNGYWDLPTFTDALAEAVHYQNAEHAASCNFEGYVVMAN